MMRHMLTSILIIGGFSLLVTLNYCDFAQQEKVSMYKKAGDIKQVITLFDMNPEQIKKNVTIWIAQAQEQLNAIISVPAYEKTYVNTIERFDHLVSLSDIAIGLHTLQGLELLSPDADIRNTAHEESLKIQAWYVESITNNKKLYNALKEYAYLEGSKDKLTEEEIYFIRETIEDFERAGLNLPDDQLETIKILHKKIQELSAAFEKNIAEDNRTISVTKNELAGLTDEFITQLQKNTEGNYILGVDYPTYFYVMDNCTVTETRKKLWQAFNNRAYPINDQILKDLLSLRDQQAKILGFDSYAAYDLSNQMVQTPERANEFLHDLVKKCTPKVTQEFAMLTEHLPEGVQLSDEGKMYPWDYAFVVNHYKKEKLAIDEEEIKEYFPMEHTIDQLLDIYRQFLNVEFVQVPVSGLWHVDVKALQVYDKTKTILLGTLFLDLYPRDNKYSHACHATMIPGTTLSDGTLIPDVSIVIANFPKPTEDKPSLLKRDDVSTFFHEFGHAMHAILGNTRIAALSGTSTKTDFVELPSQMLEEWLWDTDILKKVSKHYQTGTSLPDELIEKIQQSKTLLTGYFIQRQSYLSLLCLAYYAPGENKDVFEIMKELYTQYRTHTVFDMHDHFYAAYGHLPSYAAKYYGYLWSKVFALDIFAEIKKHGLLNGEIGAKYVETILSKGGSKDPNQLLIDFLDREPNSQAFFEDMGL